MTNTTPRYLSKALTEGMATLQQRLRELIPGDDAEAEARRDALMKRAAREAMDQSVANVQQYLADVFARSRKYIIRQQEDGFQEAMHHDRMAADDR